MAAGARHGQGLIAEPLTGRGREILRHVSDMLHAAEVTSEMYISANSVETDLGNIYCGRLAAHRGERSAESASST